MICTKNGTWDEGREEWDEDGKKWDEGREEWEEERKNMR